MCRFGLEDRSCAASHYLTPNLPAAYRFAPTVMRRANGREGVYERSGPVSCEPDRALKSTKRYARTVSQK
jgi:hypothetical protein